ncbi:MAG: radical SAM protein [Vicinamibacterales bacterium]
MSSATETADTPRRLVRSGFLPDRIVHLHPTRQCNLACTHCYSESAPSRTASALDADTIARALAVLRTEGYTAVSLSGGEPLVYPDLERVVDHAQGLGFRVTMVTNGLLVGPRLDALLGRLDGIAVSFDGLAESHNQVRGRADAFARASAAVAHLASIGRPAAAAISVSRDAIAELPDLADHLVARGVRALQIRPVARAGRARTLDAATFQTAEDRARLYLVALALQQELPEQVAVHCDLAPASGLWAQRDDYAPLLASCADSCPADRPLSDLVDPLVITDSGHLKPIAYDFAPAFDIARVDGLTPGLLRAYARDGLAGLQQLLGRLLASLEGRRGLVDWFDECTRASNLAGRA